MDTGPEERISLSFDFVENRRLALEDGRRHAARRRAKFSTLPLRPNSDWYRRLAKKQLRAQRADDETRTLSVVQHELAKSFGFPNWRAFVEEVDRRRLAALGFQQAIVEKDEASVRSALQADPAGLLDAAVVSSAQGIRWLRSVAESTPLGVAVLIVLHDELAERGEPADLAGCLDALFHCRNDGQLADFVIRERIVRASAKADRAAEVEQLEDALGELSRYDEPDFEHLSDSD